MDDVTYQKVQQYLQALKALQRSVERALQEGTFEGTGRMAVKSYQGIQRKIAELFPEDFYVTDTLTLETSDAQERHLVSQVQLAASQMIIYLDGLMREYRTATGAPSADFSEIGKLGRNLGRELQEQIINMTRATIQRAVSNIDIDVQNGESYAAVNMEGATLEGGNFSGRNLKNAVFVGAKLNRCNFSGSNLKNADFEGVDANETNFSGANLKEANFGGASLHGANLTGANLKNANLEGADLTDARLSGANFNGANLRGAILPRGEEFQNEIELSNYGASARPSSTGNARVRIEISDEDDKPKRGDYDDKPKNDDDDDLV